MTAEEIKKEMVRLQGMAKGIKLETGLLRADINKLEGCIKQDVEAADEAYQRGYEAGFAEGRKQADNEIRVGDEVIAHSSESYGTAVVTNINNKSEARYTYANGLHGWDRLDSLTKTGRHFPEVEKLLEAMRT